MTQLTDLIFELSRKLLYAWVRVEKLQLPDLQHQIDPNKPVIYVLEHRSLADVLVADSETLQKNLPRLKKPLFIPSLEDSRSVFSLQFKPLFKRSVPGIAPKLVALIKYLEENQEMDVQLVPVCMLWGRGPKKQGSILKSLFTDSWFVAGRIQKLLTVIFNGRNTYVEFSAPISLRELMAQETSAELVARKASRILRVHFRRTRTRVVGPDLSHRNTMLDSILRSPQVKKAIELHTASNTITKQEAEKEARKLAEEIAANISFANVRLMDALLTRLWNKIYNGVEVSNIESVKELAKNHEIIYAPCHRSHIDYLLLSYSLYYHGLNIPHIAAGINLNMPIVGPILRRGGAFFMRRTFKGNKLYATVFNEYIHQVFTQGYPVEYFVEGGRSRTGRTLHPKAGMLAMTMKSFLRDHSRAIAIIPVYIGYEKVFEERAYLKELNGAKKEKENLVGLIKTVRSLRNFGKVYLNFGEAIILQDFLDQHQSTWKSEPPYEDFRPPWLVSVVDKLSIELVTRINSAVALNPVNLVALTLLAAPKQALDHETLEGQLEFYANLVKFHDQNQKVTLPQGNTQQWIKYVVERNLLIIHKQNQLSNLYSLKPDKAVLLTYYRNNILHLFAVPSLIACLFSNHNKLRKSQVQERFRKVYPYIKAELFLPWDEDCANRIAENWLEKLIELGVVHRNKGGICSAPSADKLENSKLKLLAQAIMPTLERYYLTISILLKTGNGKCSSQDLEKQAQEMAKRQSILNGLNAPEFFDKALFKKFIQQLRDQGVIESNESGKIVFDDRLSSVAEDALLVLRDSVVQSIARVTGRPVLITDSTKP